MCTAVVDGVAHIPPSTTVKKTMHALINCFQRYNFVCKHYGIIPKLPAELTINDMLDTQEDLAEIALG